MKITLVLLILCTVHPLLGQLIDELPRNESGQLNYNAVVKVDSLSKDKIYVGVKQFFMNTFKSANNVIQLDDKETGIIAGKGYSDITIRLLGVANINKMWYTIKVQCKDGRYKYEIYDIFFESSPNSGRAKTNYPADIFDKGNYYRNNGEPRDISEQFKNEMNRVAKGLIAILDSEIRKGLRKSKSDDW